MKVLSAVGTRPQFNYQVLLSKEFCRRGIAEVLVHTGQHYDRSMSGQFFDELELPRPDEVLELPSGSAGAQTASILSGMEELIRDRRPDVVLVHGDVNSSTAAALAAIRQRVPVAHIEAGLRARLYKIPKNGEPEGEYDSSVEAWRFCYYNPEEINRRVTDYCSETQFPHIQEAYDSLIAEGFREEFVHNVGDVLFDTLKYSLARFGISVDDQEYVAATIHRAENTDSPERLAAIVDGMIDSELPIRFAVHPRTRKQLEHFGLWSRLERSSAVELLPPLGYRDSLDLLAHSSRVLTDSGGVRREAYLLGKPVVTAIEIVWVPSMITMGWKCVAGANRRRIIDALHEHQPSGPRLPIFGDGMAHRRIVDVLAARYA